MPAIPLRDLAQTELEESRWQRTSLPGAESAAGGVLDITAHSGATVRVVNGGDANLATCLN